MNISVCITFKERRRLPRLLKAVESVLNQTFGPKEIVIVGSKEDTLPLRKKFKNKKIKLIFFEGDKNQARNIGIMETGGTHVLYMDYDMEAESGLLAECSSLSSNYGALIIPEKGRGGNFWENCRKLEKKIIKYDLTTVTPRFFRKDLFSKNEKPFDEKFGQLDEWGFSVKLKNKGADVGVTHSNFIVTEDNLTLIKEIKNKFQRGLWMKNFFSIDKEEAWGRVNPIKRGILFYGKRINNLFSDPAHFIGLVFLKLIDLMAFMAGYLIGSFVNLDSEYKNVSHVNLYDKLGASYVFDMFASSRWNRYVDITEKNTVARIWNLGKCDCGHESILDLGMGPGRWSKFFLEFNFAQVVGLDISPVMVDVAKNNIRDKRFNTQTSDMQTIPFKKGSFQKVFCFRSFKYAKNSEKVISQIDRVISPGGTLLLEVSNNSFSNRFLKSLAWFVVRLKRNLPVESKWRYFDSASFFSPAEIRKLIFENSSLVIEYEESLFVLPSIRISFVSEVLLPVFIYLDKTLAKILPPRYFARSWVFLLRKPKNVD
ncbi:MAG: hypothetical protein A3D24_01920 [Candidatus Blackburnbacteria bacterium RIFCSPHIGHO2_02_FULL_39_13]|nr:MAG: Methyltransferase type 11 [Microgenomates group bacterium GW2011_GWA2_39_19]OGY07364.1 MAG: hypothetical protein A2694_01135 [Candidatus Blackburnbacteria bacterium RIFCSPHIGHO2_01_FULL_40_17]OGY09157.1 MAG: hypothetical protein A3D24_01920 [Candidatus Blackburnbacteria bacterium RIFCSPHIGHO2_02_FULL_39_13]